MPSPASSVRILIVLVGAALLCLAACSSSETPEEITGPGPGPGPGGDPLPEFDFDVVVFRVSTREAGGVEKVRWVGTADGPFESSPEQTRWPWVGYGRGFRVEWKASARLSPVRGTKYRVSQSDFGPWLPFEGTKAVWGEDSSFVFENLKTPGELAGGSCPEGPECMGLLRLDSGRFRMEVRALTESGREIDPELGRLEFEVNYPPSVGIVRDPGAGTEDPLASPVASWRLRDGSTVRVALAEGDTIPSGASVRFRVRGEDRLATTTDTDSFCCDVLVDAGGTQMRYQARTRFFREDVRGVRDSLFTLFEDASADSIFSMALGPFDYEAVFRSVDEHGRRGPDERFGFVVGYPPLPPTSTLADGATALLSRDRPAGPGEIGFVAGLRESLGWDPDIKSWSRTAGLLQLSGTWFEIPLGFRGEPDPRVVDVSDAPAADASPLSYGYSDHVRSFAYELIHESDPANDLAEGLGDRPERYFDVDRYGELDLAEERAWQVFVPDLLFDAPASFAPAEIFADIGDYLRQRLGSFELRVRSRTAGFGSVYHQESPKVARDLVLSLANHGRLSTVMTRTVSARVALTDDQGQVTGLWPPAP